MFLKNLKDISIVNGIWNISRFEILNVDKITETVKFLPYNGENLKKIETVENTRFPPFAQAFYYLIFQLKDIPNEELFFQEYLKWLKPIYPDNEHFIYNNEKYPLDGLRSRILRTYPSLVRDIHFYYYLLSTSLFEDVKYSLALDYYDGIDITIKYNNIEYGISVFIKTSRSISYKEKKEKRHDYSSLKEITLEANFNELNRVGNFYLLGEVHAKRVLEAIKKKYLEKT